MKKRILTLKLPACNGALIFGLLVGALNVSALQSGPPSPKAGGTITAPAIARHGQTTLTPAAPVSSQVPASTQEDIRDIRQPRHNSPLQSWAAAAAGVIILLLAAFAVWKWIRRGKFLKMLPHEVALQYLEDVRRLMDPDHAREYCFAVSKIIRRYIEERFHVHAPTLTTEEFLRDLVEARESVLEPHRALLGEFLQHCDLAKFAGWRYCLPDLEAMHASARTFVQQTGVDPAPSRTASASPASVAARGADSSLPSDGQRSGPVSCDTPVSA